MPQETPKIPTPSPEDIHYPTIESHVTKDAFIEMLEDLTTTDELDRFESSVFDPEHPFTVTISTHKRVANKHTEVAPLVVSTEVTASNPQGQPTEIVGPLTIPKEEILELIDARRKQFEKEAGSNFQNLIEDNINNLERPVADTAEDIQIPAEPVAVEQQSTIESNELTFDKISGAKNINDLCLVVLGSEGINSPSAGYFSGEDLAFLIQQVSKGDAYIEEISREFGLREKVWNLSLESGITPKSLQHIEEAQGAEEAQRQMQEAIAKADMQSEPAPIVFPPLPDSVKPKSITLINGKYVPSANDGGNHRSPIMEQGQQDSFSPQPLPRASRPEDIFAKSAGSDKYLDGKGSFADRQEPLKPKGFFGRIKKFFGRK